MFVLQEQDSVLRRKAIEYLATCTTTLTSLAQLLAQISNMVIGDEIRFEVERAVQGVHEVKSMVYQTDTHFVPYLPVLQSTGTTPISCHTHRYHTHFVPHPLCAIPTVPHLLVPHSLRAIPTRATPTSYHTHWCYTYFVPHPLYSLPTDATPTSCHTNFTPHPLRATTISRHTHFVPYMYLLVPHTLSDIPTGATHTSCHTHWCHSQLVQHPLVHLRHR